MNVEPRAFICGCLGLTFSGDETDFLRRWQPWGLILFRRNIGDRRQVSALARAFRDIVGRPDAPVLVDQEGGRVQRLTSPQWATYPAAAVFSRDIAHPTAQERAAFLAARLIAWDLAEVGITIDCMPVLDVPAPGSHAIIGDRAYASEPEDVARIGRAAAQGLLAGGVLPVIKHVPGHGRARADSHLELPRVDATIDELFARDFAPFVVNADLPIAMTAHVVFSALDAARPATLSPIVVGDFIRGRIGFEGLLMSDDLSMHALSGGFGERAQRMFAAGVDIALHCNGNPEEASAVADHSPVLTGRARERAMAALERIRPPAAGFDPVDAKAELAALLGAPLAALA